MVIPEILQNLLNDDVSGSSELARRVPAVLKALPPHNAPEAAREILRVHSSMAAVIHAVNLFFLENENRLAEVNSQPVDGETVYRNFWKNHDLRRRWATLSNSGSVAELFNRAKPGLEILAAISHPRREGLLMAEKLRERHHVTIVEDMRLPSQIEHCDGVLLGADQISKRGFVNKTGSLALALAAQYFQKPLFVVASGDKHLTDELMKWFSLNPHPPGKNRGDWFEEVPRRLVREFVITSPLINAPLARALQD